MIEKAIARRYAQALFMTAQEHNLAQKFLADFETFVAALNRSKELAAVFYNRVIGSEAKKELIKALFGQSLHPYALNFLYLILDKEREAYIGDMLEIYQELWREEQGILNVDVTTAVALEPQQEKALAAAIGNITGKKIILGRNIDAAILGGGIIKIGDSVYDGSVRHELSALHHELSK